MRIDGAQWPMRERVAVIRHPDARAGTSQVRQNDG
jgi:hypothetical protein